MNNSSYLLVLDGSAESLAAAQFAWSLASETGRPVHAQYVIDTDAIWNLLSFQQAGLVGSGIYLDAREKIVSALRSVAESVMLSYSSRAEGRFAEFDCYIDEGVPADEIAARAADHELVIIGYSPSKTSPHGLSLPEQLAQKCSCPVLAVGGHAHGWSKMQVLLSVDIADDETVGQIYGMGRRLGLPTEVFLGTGVDQVDPDSYLLGCWSRAVGVHDVKVGTLKERVKSAPGDCLIVVGSEHVAGHGFARNRGLIREFLRASDE